MKAAAFHTKGSNQIRIDLYSESTDTYPASVVLKAYSTEQDSASITESMFRDGVAHVTFNFLVHPIDEYTVLCDGTECDVNVQNSPSKNEPYRIDDFTKKTNADTESVDSTVITGEHDTESGEEHTPLSGSMLSVDFTKSIPVTRGSADVQYSGGGNRYLSTEEGLMVMQDSASSSIDDEYSPAVLNTYFKIEGGTTNLFTEFSADSDVSQDTNEVQKGISENVFTCSRKFDGSNATFALTVDCVLPEAATLSFLGCASKDTTAKLYACVLADGTEGDWTLLGTATLSDDYAMVQGTTTLTGTVRFKVEIPALDYVQVHCLKPQIETGTLASSRTAEEKTREPDDLRIDADGLDDIAEFSDGLISVSFVTERASSTGNCIMDWRTEDDGESIIKIYQEKDTNSIVAVIGETATVRSESIEMSEGDTMDVSLDFTSDGATLTVNGKETSVNTPVTLEGKTPGTMHIGSDSEKTSFLYGDILNLKVGQ